MTDPRPLIVELLRAGCHRRAVCRLALLLAFVLAGPLAAQLSYTTVGGVYTQNFNGLPTSSSAIAPASGGVGAAGSWVQLTDASIPATLRGDSTLAGWYIANSVVTAVPKLGLDTGASNTGSVFNYGTSTTSTDRALGSEGSGSNMPYFGLYIQNNTGTTLTSFTLSYTALEFRNPSTTANPWTFSYLVSSDSSANFFSTGFSSNVASLGFTTPTTGPGAPGTQTAQPAINLGTDTATISGLSIASGSYLILRWKDTDDSGSDAGAAIDNLSLSLAAAISGNATWNTTSGTWTIGTGANWTGGTGTVYTEGDNVTFNNLAGVGGTVTLNTNVAPSSVTVSATSGTYAFVGTGSINGSGTLNKSGAGILDLTGLTNGNGYTGGTIVTGGTLIISNDNQLGAALGTLSLDGASTLSITSAISSSRSITIGTGNATLATNGNNFASTGSAIINGTLFTTGAGNLAFNGVSTTFGATGAFNIGAGGSITLGGTTSTLVMSNGGVFNGDLILATNSARLQLDNSTYGGTGTIYVLGNTMGAGNGGAAIVGGAFTNFNAVITNSNAVGATGGTITSNIVLNPANSGSLTGHVAFTPGDITTANYTTASFLAFVGATTAGRVVSFNGVISGEGDLFIANSSKTGGGAGTVVFNAANTYTGNTLINASGIVMLGVDNALPTATNIIFGSLSAAQNTTLDLGGHSQQIASLSDDAAKPSGANLTITNSGATDSVLTVSGSVTPANAFGGVISDGATNKTSLVKSGTNALSLSGAHTYTGTTAVNGGTLFVNGSLSSASAVTVNSGGTLGGSGDGVATGLVAGSVLVKSGATVSPGASLTHGVGLLATGELTWQNGGNYNWQIGVNGGAAGTGYDQIKASGLDLSQLTGNGFNINLWTLSSMNPDVSGNLPGFVATVSQSWTIVTTANGITGFSAADFLINTAATNGAGGFTNSLNGGTFSLTLGNGGDDLILNFTAAASTNLIWHPGANTKWNINTDANWLNGAVTSVFTNGANVTFDDAGVGNVTIDAGGVAPSVVSVTNTSGTYTFTGGAITGSAALIKTGAGTLVLQNTNSYTGGTFLNGGIIQVSSDTALGNTSGDLDFGGGTLQAGATFSSNRSVNLTGPGTVDTNGFNITLGGVISGGGGLTKVGSGNLIFTNTNGYSGGTTINGGFIEISSDGALGAAANGITLGGGGLQFDAAITSTRAISLTDSTVSTINAGGFTSSIGAVSGTGTLTVMGGGTVTAASINGASSFEVATGTTLASTAAYTQSSGFLTIDAGGTFKLASSSTNTITNGAIDGTLLIATNPRVNFNGGIVTGAGQIQVQSTGVLLSNASGAAAGVVNVNIVLNSNNAAFTKGDVTASTFAFGTFLTTIGGTKNVNAGDNTLFIGGVISGNADVNFANSSIGGGGSGNLQLNAVNTYTGTSAINTNGASVILGVDNALPTTTDVIFGTLSGVGTPTLDLNGHNQQINSLSVGSQGTPTNFIITNNGGVDSTLTISGSTTPFNAWKGLITDGTTNKIALVKDGSSNLILTGANTYSGGTTVKGGSLTVNNTTGSGTGIGAVAVKTGAMLQGSGSISGLVTVESGGFIQGGTSNAPTTLTMTGGLALSSGSEGDFHLIGNAINGKLAITGGTFSVADSNILKVFLDFTPVSGNSFDLLDWSGSINFTGANTNLASRLVLPTLSSGLTWQTTDFNTTGVITVVPEPSRAMLLLFACFGIALRRRRKTPAVVS